MSDRTPEQLEALVLSSLRTALRVTAAIRDGVTSVAFQAPENRQAWDRLVETTSGGKTHPTLEDLRQIGVAVVEDVADAEAYVKELVEASMAGQAYLALQRHTPNIEGSPEKTIRALVSDLGDLTASANVHLGRTDQDAPDRLGRLQKMRETASKDEVIGIPTGLPVFDDKQEGFRPGEVVAVIGILGAGKSFMLTKFCCEAYRAGKKILLISPENPVADMEFRIDTFLSNMAGDQWPFTLRDLRSGFTNHPDEVAEAFMRTYAEWLEKFSFREDWVTVDTGDHGPFSAEDIVALAREHRPDMLAIDGFHLVGGGKSSWERMFDMAKQIKAVTQDLGMVTIGVAQAKREAGVIPDEPPELHEVAYGMGIVEVADRVFSLGKTRGNPKRRSFKVPKFRNGEEINVRQHLDFDVNVGYIAQIVKDTKPGPVADTGGSTPVEF